MIGSKNQGLTSEQVLENRRLHGENILTPPEKIPLWKQFLEKFEDPIIRILLFAWVLSLGISCVHCWGPEQEGFKAFLEPLGIFIAIILASTIGFIFEVKAAKAFEVLNTVNDDIMVTVLRDGKIQEVSRKEIVVGDVVMLNTGDEVPADGVLLDAQSLQINESTLTGEPVISKSVVEADFDHDATYPSNRVLRSTTVVDGNGVMCVDMVGDATEYGKVNRGAQIDNDLETPLQIQLKKLAGVISKLGYSAAGVTFILLSFKVIVADEAMGTLDIVSSLLNSFMIAVTLIVVSVPEGLPMSVTLSLALSMNRMLKTNNLVRKMHACETMGATTVICTDKTGTLTQNRMQVHETNFFALKEQSLAADSKSLLIKEGISVNSTANLNHEDGSVKTIGNPTEAALLLWLDKAGVDYMPLREKAEVVSRLTFSTERKYMATVVDSQSGKKVLYVKGAPEIVLSLCDKVDGVETENRVEDLHDAIETKLCEYQSMAMRTLGFAYKVLDEKADTAPYTDGKLQEKDLTFMGFVAISDPVREDVPDAVKSCLEAGIDVKIVTGDTPGTAREIGRQIGICDNSVSAENIITGPEFEALSDEDASKIVKALKIMCRARPMDKQRFVRLLQEQDAVVAVTGDGTNDAPALKAAQVGLSMGDGTSVAKEASDITIIDNSFTSIARAVMWGRSLYKNIQRFLLFQLTINVAACFIVMIGSLIGTSSPLTITQMLWVNLIMDTFAAAALASLPPSWNVMKERPRKSGENGDFIITKSMSVNIFVVAALFVIIQLGMLWYLNGNGGMTVYEQSLFFTFFVMLQFWNMFNAKAYMTGETAFKGLSSNYTFIIVCVAILVGQILIVTFGGEMFNVVPLSLKDWLLITVSTSLVLWLGEVKRLFSKKHVITKK